MDKRGQVTIFIIIAVLIIAGVALFFVFRPNLSEKEETVTKDYAPLYSYLQDCLEQSLIEVIYINSMQGGYYIPQGDFIIYTDEDVYFDSPIPYYLINNKLIIPSEKELENQLASGIRVEFISCIEFAASEYNLTYNPEEIIVNPDIIKERIIIELDSSININEGENSIRLKNLTVEKESNYFEYYNFAKYLTENQKLDTENICISCLVKESEAKNYTISLSSVASNEEYILINKLNNKKDDIIFSFAYNFKR
ncbi:hypothetical protein KBC25_01495 [Candidatus Pacearchaeota archaeon]|jgi:hypothetical protein|nr:hypothetical protein [Candidatus Pacearchaeota archaeon]